MESFELLEKEVGEWAGFPAENVVACSSGTAALHLAFEALQLPPGSDVICPDFTMIACPRAISLAGLKPVFVDCGPDLLMDQGLASQVMVSSGENLAAVLLVHIYGRRSNPEIVYDAKSEGLYVVEDMAEAHGVAPHPRSTAACYSFYKNKIVTSGEEGGAVAFRDPAHAALARQLRCLGFTPAHDFDHLPRGCNYKLAASLARLIVDSLRDFPRETARRRRAENWYGEHCPKEWLMPPRDAPWVYDIRVPGLTSERQGAAVSALNAAGIAARHAFKPMSAQREYLGGGSMRSVGTWNADVASREIFYLPLTIADEGQAKKAFEIVKSAVG
jgi:dTDP-4-amino-4,6-dideoxygalactose transaminase